MLSVLPRLSYEDRQSLAKKHILACLLPFDPKAPRLEMTRYVTRGGPAGSEITCTAWQFVTQRSDQAPKHRKACTFVTPELHPHNFSINLHLTPSRLTQSDEPSSYFTIHNGGSHLPGNDGISIMAYSDPDRLRTEILTHDDRTLVSGDLLALGHSSDTNISDSTNVAYNYVFRELMPVNLDHAIHQVYDFVRLVGQGSFGLVYLALDRFTGERVAIKVREAGSKDEVDTVFDYEISVLETIQALKETGVRGTSYLCAYKTSMKEETHLYSVFEYANGGDLSQLLNSLHPMGESDAKCYMKMILEGYSALYSLRLVHRDIKPANVLLHYDDAGVPHVKLADFGQTKQLPQNATMLNTICGTEAYSSPTTIKTGQRNWRTDLYAIGVTLTSLLSGVQGLNPEVFLESCCINTFSAECRDLLNGLFGECIEVHDALEHSWFTSVSPTSPCQYGGTCQCPRYANEFRPNGCQGSTDSYFARRSDSEQYEKLAQVARDQNLLNLPQKVVLSTLAPQWRPNPSASVLAAPPKIELQLDVATIRAPPRFSSGPSEPYATQSGVNRKRGGPNSLERSVGSQDSLLTPRAKRPRIDCPDVDGTTVSVTYAAAGSQGQSNTVGPDAMYEIAEEDEDWEPVPP